MDSALDPAALARARALTARPLPRESVWPALGAAALAALAALLLAMAMITAPPVTSEHIASPQVEKHGALP